MTIKAVTALPAVAALWFCAGFTTSAYALNVCADPDYLPFSNRAGEGFENKIASAVAKALGETVQYTWASHRGHGGFPQFLSSTLDAKKCDVVMDLPYGSREELTTRPYYTSFYVFVLDNSKDKSKKIELRSMDSPALKQLKVGFERDTPIEDALKIRGMVPGGLAFDVGEDSSQSPATMLNALKSGEIDVLITWQPAISGFLAKYPGLDVTPVPNDRTLGAAERFVFPMSMGVRQGDEALKNRLDGVIASHQEELISILKASQVMVLTPQAQ